MGCTSVGVWDDTNDGVALGIGNGDDVSFDEGAAVGPKLGGAVAAGAGAGSAGTGSGSAGGLRVGSGVGDGVERGAGFKLGSGIGEGVKGDAGSGVGEGVGGGVGFGVASGVSGRAGRDVGFRVGSRVGNGEGRGVGGRVGSEVGGREGPGIGARVGSEVGGKEGPGIGACVTDGISVEASVDTEGADEVSRVAAVGLGDKLVLICATVGLFESLPGLEEGTLVSADAPIEATVDGTSVESSVGAESADDGSRVAPVEKLFSPTVGLSSTLPGLEKGAIAAADGLAGVRIAEGPVFATVGLPGRTSPLMLGVGGAPADVGVGDGASNKIKSSGG